MPRDAGACGGIPIARPRYPGPAVASSSLRIHVVGGGIGGLACALRLQDEGHRVTIVARDALEDTTSAVAAAVWFPYLAEPRERVLAWASATRRTLMRLGADPASAIVERELVELEARPDDAEILSSIFRTVHSIKGASGFLEFGRLEMLAHAGERLLDAVAHLLRHTTLGRHPHEELAADAVILACGGFESDANLRAELIGPDWSVAKVRGTPHNTGDGLKMAEDLGAVRYGRYDGCHATPMDLHMKDFGNLDLPPKVRKNYRKICYFLGVMLNARGERFVDEGINFRNYTSAQFGRAVLEQPQHFAWQLFDDKVKHLLYGEYHFEDASFVEADTLEELIAKLEGVDKAAAQETLRAYNAAVDETTGFDPTVLDGKSTRGLALEKTNWAQKLDTPPFRAYPVTGGITFTYGGLKVNEMGSVLREDQTAIDGLYAAGEMVGGVFFGGYPGGSGLTSGTVFGRRAGMGAAG